MKNPGHKSGTDSKSSIEVVSRQPGSGSMGKSGRSPRKNASTGFTPDDGSTSGASSRSK